MAKLFFPRATLAKMASLGVTEFDIYDIFSSSNHKQTDSKTFVAVKKYHDFGYELGIFYTNATYPNYDYNVTAVWKKTRK